MPFGAIRGPRVGGSERPDSKRFPGVSAKAVRPGSVLIAGRYENQSNKEKGEQYMYENPKLIRVGEVEEVVLGYNPSGDDIDGNYNVPYFEFAEELDIENPGA
jgi:hypothetical protein